MHSPRLTASTAASKAVPAPSVIRVTGICLASLTMYLTTGVRNNASLVR